MCGRYTITVDAHTLADHFGTKSDLPEGLVPRYNLAPSQQAPVVVDGEIRAMRWGLIPSWAKDHKIGYKLINARAETVAEKPSFRHAYRKQRCLVPADGFYEWKHKEPYRFILDRSKLFAFAGLWESWHAPTGELIESFTIITTEANEVVSKVHDRMPAILTKRQENHWLVDGSLDLLQPFEGKMRGYRVSPLVNRVKNELSACIESVKIA